MRRGRGTPGGVIHIDLDGPILDVSERYFHVHQSIVGRIGRADEAKADELEALGLKRFFVEVLYSDTVPSWQVKRELIQRSGPASRRPSMIVGDTEADVVAGVQLGVTPVAVANGIRTRGFLERLGPDVVIPDITFLPAFLESGSPERSSRRHAGGQVETPAGVRRLHGHGCV